MTIARQSIYFGGKAQFGDGKPVVLIPDLSSHLPFLTARRIGSRRSAIVR